MNYGINVKRVCKSNSYDARTFFLHCLRANWQFLVTDINARADRCKSEYVIGFKIMYAIEFHCNLRNCFIEIIRKSSNMYYFLISSSLQVFLKRGCSCHD